MWTNGRRAARKANAHAVMLLMSKHTLHRSGSYFSVAKLLRRILLGGGTIFICRYDGEKREQMPVQSVPDPLRYLLP